MARTKPRAPPFASDARPLRRPETQVRSGSPISSAPESDADPGAAVTVDSRAAFFDVERFRVDFDAGDSWEDAFRAEDFLFGDFSLDDFFSGDFFLDDVFVLGVPAADFLAMGTILLEFALFFALEAIGPRPRCHAGGPSKNEAHP
jgi:hypothetical protein